MIHRILLLSLAALTAGCATSEHTVSTADHATGHGTGGPAHWSYAGAAGPEHWGALEPEFSACAAGANQTPIDIHGTISAALPPLRLDYRTLGHKVVNNGHSIQVNVAPGSSLTINGVAFTLKQFHFHAPSENVVDGKHYAIEAHFVHADPAGHLAVIGVLYRLGKADPTLARLWAASPKEAGAPQALRSPIDPKALLPRGRGYYAFNGSLTTPPCTEGVRWMVLKDPLTVSQEQVDFLQQAVKGPNNRPVQPVNARILLR